MAYYWTCPHCGENLDPGERASHVCDDREKKDTRPAAVYIRRPARGLTYPRRAKK